MLYQETQLLGNQGDNNDNTHHHNSLRGAAERPRAAGRGLAVAAGGEGLSRKTQFNPYDISYTIL